ncbi:hypothetical protein BBI01_18035 [Chryseobacterium artocarpi]|uniref:MobA/VirD2-like nuclease domain-containing protein n=1 Tax=Chryseobacterium artocarpi TaxID=1414727 RepID=A0A1B8ZBY0_9FLAO|nr:relaxase/mobilization nuclease domain-containing protein [Chryseobacterium artocarpi]OCA69109.1 hypothetical protein BBI01_18035 [Chryseobacterium artocarpi]
MIVKILNRSSQEFNGVLYNDKKIEKGKGELLKMKNFPSHINSSSGTQDVKNYLKAISKNNQRVKNPQFHATISAQGRSYSKEQLALTADKFMEKMGYGEQPYIVVFHNDTPNNHVHIVSTRVHKDTSKRIERDFEKYKSQSALQETIKELYGNDVLKNLEKIMDYNYSTMHQLQSILELSGYGFYKKNDQLNITKNGTLVKQLYISDLNFFEKSFDEKRKKQIFALFKKYKEVYSNSIFRVSDKNHTSYQSELQYQLKKKFGIDVVLSFKDDKVPFGYSIIDHKTYTIYKGSDIMKLGDLFTISSQVLDKKIFDILTNSNLTIETKNVYKKHLEQEYKCEIQDYMIFLKNSKKTDYNIWKDTRNSTIDYILNLGKVGGSSQDKIKIVSFSNETYIINKIDNVIFTVKELVGDYYHDFYLSQLLNPQILGQQSTVSGSIAAEQPSLEEMLKRSSLFGNSAAPQPSNEEQENKRRKKKKKR